VSVKTSEPTGAGIVTVHVRELLEVVHPLAPDDSCTIMSGMDGLGDDPLTETKLMRSEPVLGETYWGVAALDVALGTRIVKVAVPAGFVAAACAPGTDELPAQPASNSVPITSATLRRITGSLPTLS
jgi:hypothetical protein